MLTVRCNYVLPDTQKHMLVEDCPAQMLLCRVVFEHLVKIDRLVIHV